MPIKVTDQGWVKMPPVKRKAKKTDPVDIFRGPLAYITGRPDFKEPVKKQSIKQLMIEAASAPPVQPYIEDRAPRSHHEHRSKRIPSEPVPSKSRRTRSNSYEEADEEIPRQDYRADDLESRRSASPIGSRRGGTSVRSRKDPPRPHSVYDEGYEVEAKIRSRRHVSSSVYDEPIRVQSNRHSYHRERDYSVQPVRAQPMMAQPTLQPIIIYSTPPSMGGCAGHGCQTGMYQHQCYATPQPMLMGAARAAIEGPIPGGSVVSSRSSSSSKSRPMSYKWYTATQPLNI